MMDLSSADQIDVLQMAIDHAIQLLEHVHPLEVIEIMKMNDDATKNPDERLLESLSDNDFGLFFQAVGSFLTTRKIWNH